MKQTNYNSYMLDANVTFQTMKNQFISLML